MKSGLDRLFEAIIADDLSSARKLLKEDPFLTKAVVERPHLYLELPHWIYVGDTALHAAAAGHRGKMVELLIGAGADASAAQNHRRSQPLHYAADGSPQRAACFPKCQVEVIR